MKKEIKIAGAGPAGLTAAINLTKAGYKVKVYEQNSDVGFKSQGDFQGLENWTQDEDILKSLKRMNIQTNFKYTPIKSFDVFDYTSKKYVFKSKRPLCYFVQRGSKKNCLDHALKQQALAAGVKIIFNKKLPLTKADIVASGFTNRSAIGEGITFDTDIPNTVMVIRDDYVAPGAYAYLIVINKKACLISFITTDFDKADMHFKRSLKRFQKLKKFKIKNKRREGCFGTFFITNSAIKNKRLHVGEAAGFQDYLFGFGMRYAITSGYLAAQSIIQNKNYDELWKAEFGGLLMAGLANRFRFEFAGSTGFKNFAEECVKQDFVTYFSNLYRLSAWKLLLYHIAKVLYSNRKVFK